MIDTSVIERKIHDQVMDMTFKAIVTEAFIGGLPIAEGELTKGLTQGFVGYANECLEDLGSYRLLDQAIESAKDPAKKAYLKKMKSVCMEAAQDVTARILKENAGNDKDLINEAKAVTMTPAEYARFSKNAASLTPESLTKMIQKKTLDVIKEEKEAYQKDAELEAELKNALGTTTEDEEEPISTEPEGDAPNGPDTQSEAPQQDVNGMQANNDQPTGADIGQKADDIASAMNSIGNESYFTDVQNKSKDDPAQNITGAQIGMACPCPIHQQKESNADPVKKAVGHQASSQIGQQGMHQEAVKGTPDPKKAQEAFESYMKALAGEHNRPKHSSIFSRLQELAYESMLGTTESYSEIPFRTMANVTKNDTFDVFHSHGNRDLSAVAESLNLYAFESILDRFKREGRKVAEAMSEDDLIKAYLIACKEDGLTISTDMDALKKEMEATLNTNERNGYGISYDFKKGVNDAAICVEHDGKSKLGVMVLAGKGGATPKVKYATKKDMVAVVGRYMDKKKKENPEGAATESAGIPDAPGTPVGHPAPPPPPAPGAVPPPPPPAPKEEAALGNSLLVASIIYTFFETLNSMNLYCPKLKEIRDFVDDTLPIKDRVSLDGNAFKGMIQNLISSASTELRKADTTQDIDAMQQKLDIVREKMAAPGFEAARYQIKDAVESIQAMLDKKRDEIVAKSAPKQVAVESYTDTLKRTRDLMKFDRASNLLGRKPNVTSLRCKVDPQAGSKYIAVEAFDARHNVVGKSTIVLESAMLANLVDYAVTTIKSSKMMNLDKPIAVTDARSGKTYYDSAKD